jgi:predicted outer membrane protein
MRKPLQEGKMATLERSPARRLAVCGAAVLALSGFAGVRGMLAADPETPESAAHHALLALNAGEAEEGQLAASTAVNARVRSFGQMMATEHGSAVALLQTSMGRVGLLGGTDLAAADYNRGSNSQGVDAHGHPIPENNSGSPNGSTGFSAAGTDLNRDPGNGQPIVANNGAANGVAVGPGDVSANATRTVPAGSGSMNAEPSQGAPAGQALGSNGQLLDRNGKPIPENNSGHPTGTVGEGRSVFAADAPQPASAGGDHPGGKPASQAPQGTRMAAGQGHMVMQPASTWTAGDPRLHAMLMGSAYSRPIVEDHMQAMARLQALHGAAFDRAYMDRQVMAHQYALRTIDGMLPALRPGASSETVRMTEQMRATVARHLAMAQQLRATLRAR